MSKRTMNFSCRGLLLMAVLFMAACNQRPSNERQVGAQPRIFPDYVGVTVPADIAPLNFAMADDSVTRIDVTLQGDNGGSLHVNGTYADFPLDAWHELLQRNRGGQLRVSVAARRDGHWTRYSTFLISVSEDSIGAQAVSYRRIAPGYEQYGHMGIYERRLSDFTETTLVDNAATPGQCINCHTSNGGRSNEYVYHARGEKPGTFLLKGQGAKGKGQDPENIATEDSRDLIGGAMVYPGWHPGGRYIAFSTNKTSQMFHLANAQKRIEVYDASSDVFVYDIQTRSVLRDTLTMRHLWAENCPAFSPDGRWLYFVTARRQVYPTDYQKECYSLCRVPFDERTGHYAGAVDTLVRAGSDGIPSVAWSRPTPDGRHVLFVVTQWGYFSIWHPEADLWLLDMQTGECRPLDEVNSQRAESFPSCCSRSRWFLFTSRRGDGLYSRIYFSHLNADGRATKPFLLPQRNPKDYDLRSLYSFNTPEFRLTCNK